MIPGSDFRGLVSYNENKVAEGTATFLVAGNYPLAKEKLRFEHKLGTLERRAALRPRVDKKVIHLIVSFSPKDDLDNELIGEIAVKYMDLTGLGQQPYLVYRHHDAAHPHLHIITTNIDSRGERIQTFRFGKYKSNPARIALEQEYGLVRAEDQKEVKDTPLDPGEIKALDYGKTPTKGAISNVVRSVIAHYHVTSLPELNAALRLYNVTCDRGRENTQMYLKKGILYAAIDEKGEKRGKGIKASTIYEKPTLPALEKLFERNKGAKTDGYKERLRRVIDDVLTGDVTDKKSFAGALQKEQVFVIFRENEEGKTYGVTFVDKKSRCVFNGSDLAHNKAYTARGILQRLSGGNSSDILSNKIFTRAVLSKTEYQGGFSKVLTTWIHQGMLVTAELSVDGAVIYKMGYALSDRNAYVRADKRLSGYFAANDYTPARATRLLGLLDKEYAALPDQQLLSIPVAIIETIIRAILTAESGNNYLDYRWEKESRKRRRRRR